VAFDYLHAERRVIEAPEDGGEDEARDGHGGQAHPEKLRRALDVLPRPPHQHQDLRPPRIRERAHCLRVRLGTPHLLQLRFVAALHCRLTTVVCRRSGRSPRVVRTFHLRGFRCLRFHFPLSAVFHQVLDPFLSCRFMHNLQFSIRNGALMTHGTLTDSLPSKWYSLRPKVTVMFESHV
jgi:hypothetical protein